ncbi:MAG: hypothetical protein K2F65_04730 [Eubacterium sp.]|nr:hypothetical protein [Eubacterium sp.]
MDNDIIDNDGYPKYILINCEDIDNRMWTYEFKKIRNGQDVFYILHSSELQ